VGGPEAALLLILVVHVIGSIVLIWALFTAQDPRPDFRSWWRGDDGPDPPAPPRPPRGPSGDDVPLPDAEQAPARLRQRGRLADRYPAPSRRPTREPAREPARRS
jgi:hypothetical protein